VTFSPLPQPIKAGTQFSDWRDARLSWPSWLVTYRGCTHAQRRLAIPVLIGFDVELLRWWDDWRYHYAKPRWMGEAWWHSGHVTWRGCCAAAYRLKWRRASEFVLQRSAGSTGLASGQHWDPPARRVYCMCVSVCLAVSPHLYVCAYVSVCCTVWIVHQYSGNLWALSEFCQCLLILNRNIDSVDCR